MLQNFAQLTQKKLLEELNLVSREEFDAQTIVLSRTRQKLEELERQLAAVHQHQREQQQEKPQES